MAPFRSVTIRGFKTKEQADKNAQTNTSIMLLEPTRYGLEATKLVGTFDEWVAEMRVLLGRDLFMNYELQENYSPIELTPDGNVAKRFLKGDTE